MIIGASSLIILQNYIQLTPLLQAYSPGVILSGRKGVNNATQYTITLLYIDMTQKQFKLRILCDNFVRKVKFKWYSEYVCIKHYKD